MLYELSILLFVFFIGLSVVFFMISIATAILTWPAVLNIEVCPFLKKKFITCRQYLSTNWKQLLTVSSFLIIIGLTADLISIGALFQLKQVERMTGDVRIAVAESVYSGAHRDQAGNELANNVTRKLTEALSKDSRDYTVTVWGPDRVGSVMGRDESERAKSAAGIAKQIGADLVIYGLLNDSDLGWSYTPEFFIDAQNSYEVIEITGSHGLGVPIQLKKDSNIADHIESSNELSNRIQMLVDIAVGLAYYMNQNYEKSQHHWRQALNKSTPKNENEEKVLFLLLGNAAGKNNQIDLAKAYYERCISIDSNYARAYIGLANAYYIEALHSEVDYQLLYQAIRLFKIANKIANQPEFSDISTKIHFGLGQSYLILSNIDPDITIDMAINEFSAVIHEYEVKKNYRVRVLAGESHARLGLIMYKLKNLDSGIREYQIAIELLRDYPTRQIIYKRRVEELQKSSGDMSK
jgi:tetratricopeptide (TPR) repeat protein